MCGGRARAQAGAPARPGAAPAASRAALHAEMHGVLRAAAAWAHEQGTLRGCCSSAGSGPVGPAPCNSFSGRRRSPCRALASRHCEASGWPPPRCPQTLHEPAAMACQVFGVHDYPAAARIAAQERSGPRDVADRRCQLPAAAVSKVPEGWKTSGRMAARYPRRRRSAPQRQRSAANVPPCNLAFLLRSCNIHPSSTSCTDGWSCKAAAQGLTAKQLAGSLPCFRRRRRVALRRCRCGSRCCCTTTPSCCCRRCCCTIIPSCSCRRCSLLLLPPPARHFVRCRRRQPRQRRLCRRPVALRHAEKVAALAASQAAHQAAAASICGVQAAVEQQGVQPHRLRQRRRVRAACRRRWWVAGGAEAWVCHPCTMGMAPVHLLAKAVA